MDKEVVIHIHNGILLSYKKIKECTWVSSDEEDEPGAYYREWSKSERERQTLYINTYIWDLERQYQWFYVQGSKHRCKEQTFGLNGRRFSSVQFSSVAQSCPTLYNPMNCSMPGLPVHQQLPESTQTHVHWVSNAIQPSHPLLSPSPPALNLSQHQGLFQWVSSSHQVAKVLEFQLQHKSFQWTPRTDLL